MQRLWKLNVSIEDTHDIQYSKYSTLLINKVFKGLQKLCLQGSVYKGGDSISFCVHETLFTMYRIPPEMNVL